MIGEMLKPLEGRPYLDQWKERMAKPAKVKPKPRKKGRKKVRK